MYCSRELFTNSENIYCKMQTEKVLNSVVYFQLKLLSITYFQQRVLQRVFLSFIISPLKLLYINICYMVKFLPGLYNNNNNNQFNKTTLQYIYTLNYMAKFMKYLKIIRANNCSLLVTRTCKFFKRVYTIIVIFYSYKIFKSFRVCSLHRIRIIS